MSRSDQEEVFEKLFEHVLILMDIAEDNILEGEGALPEEVLDDVEKILLDCQKLRDRDREIRQSIGIKEDSFQSSIQGTVGLNRYRRRLLERIEKLKEDITEKERRIQRDLTASERNLPPSEREGSPEKAREQGKLHKFRKAGGVDDWKPI